MIYPTEYIEIVYRVLLVLFLFSVLVQIVYYTAIYGRILYFRRAPQLKKYPVSVIICARNEADNLRKNLPSVLEQKHEEFEVIVVNDCSNDETDEVLEELTRKYEHLKVTRIVPDVKFTHGKKLAVTLGIKASKYEWLVFTDADCYAETDQWLNRIQEGYTDKSEIVIGYGGYTPKPGFLNKYIRFDTLFIAMQYFGFALARMPYMGVGRNLSYRKSLFFKNKGFASHYGIASGDDDLFVNEAATKENLVVEFHPESHTRSEPKQTWSDWFIQKKRHLSTAGRYKALHVFMLGFEPFSRVLFYITLVALLCFKVYLPFVIGFALLRFAIQLTIVKLIMKRLNEQSLLFWVVVFDLISLFLNFILYLSTRFRSKKSRWK